MLALVISKVFGYFMEENVSAVLKEVTQFI